MKPLRNALATLLLATCAAIAQAPVPDAGDAADVPVLEPSVPPVILTNVIVQAIGEERNHEELPAGLIFLDADNGSLMFADEDNPHGRAVCACKGYPDYHNLTNTLRVNGNRIELNASYSIQAEGDALSIRAGTNSLLQILHSPHGELAPLTCTTETDRTLLLVANAPADSTVQICTNLLESPRWSTATNAVIVETTDAATTWRITLLDSPVPEFYRVLSSISLDAGIYARLPIHATQGIDIDTTNGLTMGDNTWTNLPNLDAYASTGSVAAVATDLSAHTSATNPHAVTAAQVGALPLTGGTITGHLSVTGPDYRYGKLSHGLSVTNSGIYSFAGGEKTKASAQNTFAFGYLSEATTYGAQAFGGRSRASATFAQAAGLRAVSTNARAYTWQGEDSSADYGSHGDGTWNINPADGLEGVFVGETHFSSEAWTFVLTNGQSVTKHVVLYGD